MTTIGKMIGLIGPPGTGKSEFIARAEAWARKNGKRIAVACIPHGERDSYPNNDIFVVKTFDDTGWAPLDDKYKATGYMALYRWLGNLAKVPDIGLVAVDTMSSASILTMQDTLATASTGDPKDIEYGGAYTGHDRRFNYLHDQLDRLCVAGKHVVCTWHGEMREMEGKGKVEEVTTMMGKELAWSEQYSPSTQRAKSAQKIPGWFSLWLFASVKGVGTGAQYSVTSLPVEGVPAKRRKNVQLTLPKPFTEAAMPNDFSFMMEALGL